MLQRKAYDILLAWKRDSAGNSALLVEGARRVGKTTLVADFGRREYKSCLFIDFNEADREVISYFEDYRTDLDALFLYLSTYYRVDLYERDSLVVFDEVQLYPPARALVKFLVADGRYDYIETGSSRAFCFLRKKTSCNLIRSTSRSSSGQWASDSLPTSSDCNIQHSNPCPTAFTDGRWGSFVNICS